MAGNVFAALIIRLSTKQKENNDMRIITCALLLLMLAVLIAAQEKDKWRRIYTYEDSTIAMNVSRVTFGLGDDGKVMFRTVWSKPVALKETPGAQFKSRVETIEFRCAERRFRISEATLFDSDGKAVKSYEVDPSTKWEFVKSGGMMERLFGPACSLINEKRRKQ